jgi:hypothetical protein
MRLIVVYGSGTVQAVLRSYAKIDLAGVGRRRFPNQFPGALPFQRPHQTVPSVAGQRLFPNDANNPALKSDDDHGAR